MDLTIDCDLREVEGRLAAGKHSRLIMGPKRDYDGIAMIQCDPVRFNLARQ